MQRHGVTLIWPCLSDLDLYKILSGLYLGNHKVLEIDTW